MPIVYTKSLRALGRMRRRWENAQVKNERARENGIARIDSAISERTQRRPLRCSLPKKQQRAMGLLPPVN